MQTFALGPSVDPRDNLYLRYLGPLAVDKYALTMASALFEADPSLFNADASFQMFFRKLPKNGMKNEDGSAAQSPYLLTAGLPFLASWMEGWSFSPGDLATLRDEKDGRGQRLYSDRFLDHLKDSRLSLDIDAMPDGTVAFPKEPMLRVKGPFWQCLMVEKMMLSIMNACSNKATLTAQAVEAAGGRPVWEYGGRRDSEPSGMLTAYSAFVAGAAGTSNYLAKKFFGIPAGGTMAHALVMVSESEIGAFRSWAKGAPGLGMFLVDTYDTLQGVHNAIQVCREEGVDLQGIRLDSGNLGKLAKEARQLLDAAGFKGAKIFASNDLNPQKIRDLADAPIDAFGVGTWIASAEANPALGGVYKLAEVRRGAAKRQVMKFSEEPGKATLPGLQDVIRLLSDDGRFAGDALVPAGMLAANDELPHNLDLNIRTFNRGAKFVRLLEPFVRGGSPLPLQSAQGAQQRAKSSLAHLDSSHKRLTEAEPYPVGIEAGLNAAFQGALARKTQPRLNVA